MSRHKMKGFGSIAASGTVGGILSRLYHTILNDLGMTLDRYSDLMQRYMQRTLRNPNRNDKASARESLSKELLKDSMTWKTFLKGLSFLSVETFDFIITLYHHNGGETQHKITIRLQDFLGDDGLEMGMVLSRLIRIVLDELGIDQARYNSLMIKYIQKTHITASSKDKSTLRSTFSKELLKESMTWKTFVKGITFLNIPKFKISLILNYPMKRVTKHHLTIILEDIVISDENEES